MRSYMEDGGKIELSTEQRVQKGGERIKRLDMKQRLLGEGGNLELSTEQSVQKGGERIKDSI